MDFSGRGNSRVRSGSNAPWASAWNFHVNGPHNFVHLLTGIVALICGYQSAHASKLYFLIFGIVYGLVALLGFVVGNGLLLGFIANNIADAWLHVGIAIVSIALGLMPEEVRTPTRASMP